VHGDAGCKLGPSCEMFSVPGSMDRSALAFCCQKISLGSLDEASTGSWSS
jgi:hypothetical protein